MHRFIVNALKEIFTAQLKSKGCTEIAIFEDDVEDQVYVIQFMYDGNQYSGGWEEPDFDVDSITILFFTEDNKSIEWEFEVNRQEDQNERGKDSSNN